MTSMLITTTTFAAEFLSLASNAEPNAAGNNLSVKIKGNSGHFIFAPREYMKLASFNVSIGQPHFLNSCDPHLGAGAGHRVSNEETVSTQHTYFIRLRPKSCEFIKRVPLLNKCLFYQAQVLARKPIGRCNKLRFIISAWFSIVV